MFEFLFSHQGFMPYGQCYLWRPALLWLHIGSDTLITIAYYSIPASIFMFARQRPELKFRSLYWLFGLFIFLCGTTHLFGIVTTFKPFYLAEGVLKLFTGLASAATAIAIWKLWPKALSIPSTKELDETNQKLAELNGNLERRVSEKTEKLIQADKAKDQFLAMVSHELRSPLAIVAGYFELLEMSDGGDPEEREFALRNIKSNLNKQQVLLNNLVDVSRIISGNFPFEMQDTDLSKLIHDTIDGLALKAEQNQVTIERKISPDLGSAHCDGLRISQVITNLVENAIKFSPQDSSIQVTCETDSVGNLILTVKDNGVGILPDQLPFVFEHYWQSGENKQHHSVSGLGLGLAISKHIIEGHGGKITVTSDGLGKGAEFAVILPKGKLPGTPIPPQPSEGHESSGKIRKDLQVLIVDDNYDVLQLLSRLTCKLGMTPLITSTVKDAIDILSKRPVDVILSDISLPTIDGLDFIETVRRVEKNKNLTRRVAIAISANVSEKQRVTALEAGFDAFLSKPVTANQLLGTISGLIREKQS